MNNHSIFLALPGILLLPSMVSGSSLVVRSRKYIEWMEAGNEN